MSLAPQLTAIVDLEIGSDARIWKLSMTNCTLGEVVQNNFRTAVWTTERRDFGSWSDSLMLCLFSFSGFEQPFYVITEVESPRRRIPKYTIMAALIAILLFMLVNISYFLVIDKESILGEAVNGWYLSPDLATLFFDNVFPGDHERAARSMAAFIAISIFGNLWVMTFTAARVKQEIAKEGILPWSLFFATSYRTPYGLCQEWLSKGKIQPELVERAPTAAFSLHWLTSILLIAVTSPISDPRKSYSILVYLFTYSIILVLGGWVSFGLLLVKLRQKTTSWRQRRRYRPWLSPLHVIVYGITTSFLAIAAFVPPSTDSPFYHSVTGVPWYILPAIGLSAPAWGILWYFGFRVYERVTEKQLEIRRESYCVSDPRNPNEYVQAVEIISQWWIYKVKGKMANDVEASRDSTVASRDFVSNDNLRSVQS